MKISSSFIQIQESLSSMEYLMPSQSRETDPVYKGKDLLKVGVDDKSTWWMQTTCQERTCRKTLVSRPQCNLSQTHDTFDTQHFLSMRVSRTASTPQKGQNR